MNYQVKTITGDVYVWDGDLGPLPFDGQNLPPYPHLALRLVCQAGTRINLAHVVTMTPVDE